MEKLIEDSVVIRAWRKVEEMAEKHGMTREEWIKYCDHKHYSEKLTDNEVKLIWAYQTYRAIEKLKSEGKDRLARFLETDNYWIRSWKNDFKDIDKAMKRLTEICSHVKSKFDVEYEHEWLLNYDEDLYEKTKEEKKHGIPGRRN